MAKLTISVVARARYLGLYAHVLEDADGALRRKERRPC
jgi:hypothetical protein